MFKEMLTEHSELSEKTWFRISIKHLIRGVIAVAVTAVSCTVAICAYLNKLEAGQQRIEQALAYRVNQAQFVQWSAALDKANRDLQPHALNVPDPLIYRSLNGTPAIP